LRLSRLLVSVALRRPDQLSAHGAKPALHLALALRLIRTGMDQRHAQPGAHQGQVLGAIVGAVVHVQALRQPPAQQRLLEHRQEGLRLGQGS